MRPKNSWLTPRPPCTIHPDSRGNALFGVMVFGFEGGGRSLGYIQGEDIKMNARGKTKSRERVSRRHNQAEEGEQNPLTECAVAHHTATISDAQSTRRRAAVDWATPTALHEGTVRLADVATDGIDIVVDGFAAAGHSAYSRGRCTGIHF